MFNDIHPTEIDLNILHLHHLSQFLHKVILELLDLLFVDLIRVIIKHDAELFHIEPRILDFVQILWVAIIDNFN